MNNNRNNTKQHTTMCNIKINTQQHLSKIKYKFEDFMYM